MNDLEKQMHKEFDEKEKKSNDSPSKIKADDWVHVRKNSFMGDPEVIAESLKGLLDQHAAEERQA